MQEARQSRGLGERTQTLIKAKGYFVSALSRYSGDRKRFTSTPGAAANEPMRRVDAPVWVQALRQNWRSWLKIVESVARQKKGQCRIDEKTYRALHADLIACCCVLADDDKPRLDFYAHLEQLVRPWLTMHVLIQADREILMSLCHQCRQIDEQLNGPRQGYLGRWALLGVVGLAGAVLFHAWDTVEPLWLAVADQLASLWRASESIFQQSTETHRLLAAGFLGALVAMAVAWKTARN